MTRRLVSGAWFGRACTLQAVLVAISTGRVLVHSTKNPDHLVPNVARGSGGVLRVAARTRPGEAMQYHQWILWRPCAT